MSMISSAQNKLQMSINRSHERLGGPGDILPFFRVKSTVLQSASKQAPHHPWRSTLVAHYGTFKDIDSKNYCSLEYSSDIFGDI